MTRSHIGITLLCAAAAVALTAAARNGAIDVALATASGVRSGQLWRLVTGPLVHATWGHLLRDLALLIFVGVGFGAALGRRFGLVFAAGLVVPAAAVFAVEPDLTVYYGTSGLTHALLAAAVIASLRDRDRAVRTLAALAGAALAFKLGFELFTGGPLFPMDLGAGVRQLPSAHAAGAIAGALALARPQRSSRCSKAAVCESTSEALKVRS